jgi:hypothetical protein
MRRELTPSDVELLAEIVERRAAELSLIDALRHGQLTEEQARTLGDLATLELAERGFDAGYEPTSAGRRLEDIIDALAET